MLSARNKFLRRKMRNSKKILNRKNAIPRLSVFRSNNHIYAQVIDDLKRHTVVSASSLDSDLPKEGAMKALQIASFVGKKIAELALSKGVSAVVFDRGGYLFHGKIRELALSARNNGLKF